MPSFDVKNSVAFVTGANKSSGIGQAIVVALLDAGAAKVYATARKASQLETLVASYPDKVVAVGLDLTNLKQLETLSSLCPDVNLIVNNAGYAGFINSIEDVEKSLVEILVNYVAPLAIVKSFAPVFENQVEELGGDVSTRKDRKASALVNINSITSYVNFPFFATYSASKAASHSLTQAQRRDLKNTLVIGVYPGPTDLDALNGADKEMTMPVMVARAVLDALAQGIEDVFPDTASKAIHREWQTDAKLLEKKMAG